jgi:hypothetical protein
MKGDAALRDVQYPGHTGQIEAIRGNIASGHMSRGTFVVCDELISNRRCIPPAQAFMSGGDARRKDDFSVFVSQQQLIIQPQLNAFVLDRDLWR